MNLKLDEAIALLERTPGVLTALLGSLPHGWEIAAEGGDSWSPFDVLGHFVHGERTDWIPRARIILEHGDQRAFEPFDRFAQFTESQGKSLSDLLREFAELRRANIRALQAMNLQPDDLERRGRHPALGEVTLGQLIATWAVHDLNHLNQISHTLAHQYQAEVGPWRVYLGILND
jgi:hypothetical protein